MNRSYSKIYSLSYLNHEKSIAVTFRISTLRRGDNLRIPDNVLQTNQTQMSVNYSIAEKSLTQRPFLVLPQSHRRDTYI